MKILIALTYYRPHVSGLTIYVERLARALAGRGHTVTVLTSRYAPDLPLTEIRDGVNVVRVPVAFRISKGVVMPTFGLIANRLVPQHDILSLHLPQLDAAGLALRGPLFRKPVTLTYHSDLLLPPSPLNWLASRVIYATNHIAARFASTIIGYTEDFARHSHFLSKYLPKVTIIPPPVELPIPSAGAVEAFRQQHGLAGRGPVIGLAVRLAAEKGVEYLLQAMPAILARYPNAVIAHAGPREAIGEAAYLQKLQPLLDQFRAHYVHVGTLDMDGMARFFSACAVHVLPSINSTETFGLVQIEAALCGTPTVASALPGVRMPTQMTGMGRTVPPMDVPALAAAVLEVLDNHARYVRPRAPIAEMFSPQTTAAHYEAVFAKLLK